MSELGSHILHEIAHILVHLSYSDKPIKTFFTQKLIECLKLKN